MSKDTHDRIKGAFGTLSVIALVVCMVVMLSSWKDSALAKTAHGFVESAAIGNEFEIESSQIAVQRSMNDTIRQVAQHMIDDHKKASDDMTAALQQSSTPIAGPDAHLDAKHQAMLNDLNNKSGKEFDMLYVKDQVDAHHEAVKLFGNYATQGSNMQLKDFAAKTLPTLQEHQQQIEQIKASY